MKHTMATIVPRWEWRAFATRFGPAEAAFAALTPEATHDSDEIYLLASGGANVKVRDGLLDIKILEEIDAVGLERWVPVMKEAFPISREVTVEVLDALGVDPPNLDRHRYSLDHLLDEIIEPSRMIRAVRVHKHRVRFTVGGCMAEFTDVVVDGHTAKTIAVESPDPAAVANAVRALGLVGYRNVNYPAGLARIIEARAERYAVIDVGTNSVKFHVAERAAEGSWNPVVDGAEVTQLGRDLAQGGVITRPALDRTAAAIADMAEVAREHHATAVVAVGTAGMRIAGNQGEVIDAIRDRAGVTVEVLSGEEESRIAYLAVASGLGPGDGSLVVFDTGGGSSEFTFGDGAVASEHFSVDVGAVRYTERFGLDGVVSTDTLQEALDSIAGDLSFLNDHASPDRLVGMGGAVTNMTAVGLSMATYDPSVVQGATLSRSEINRQIHVYRSLNEAGRRSIVGLQPNRAGVILAGACIVATVMDELAAEALTVSDRGLRHGILVERFGGPLPMDTE